jgi:hypothetical protein
MAYMIGKGRPPRDHQFRPGESGNPAGRPRRDPDLADLFRKELGKTVEVNEQGQKLALSKREAVVKALVDASARGDLRAINTLFVFLERSAEDVTDTPEHAPEDAEIVSSFAGRTTNPADAVSSTPAEPTPTDDADQTTISGVSEKNE